MAAYDLVLDTDGIRRHVRTERVDEVIVNENTIVFMTEGDRAQVPGLVIGTRTLVSMQKVRGT